MCESFSFLLFDRMSGAYYQSLKMDTLFEYRSDLNLTIAYYYKLANNPKILVQNMFNAHSFEKVDFNFY